jgi:RNA polymerase sigma-70 factor (ECF subfamily)
LLSKLAADWPDRASGPLQESLTRCIDRLTPNNRELLRLRYFETRSCVDVAEILGRKVESVYQALARIHKTLGDCVRSHLGQETG